MEEEGQAAWFTRLYVQFHPRVLAYVSRRIISDQAHEVADETFLIAWRRRTQLPKSVLPWLLVTARNVMSEHVRRSHRQDAIAVELAKYVETTTQGGADVVAIERILVLTALTRLNDQDREALILTVWDDLSHTQAALVAGCSVPTFAVRVHRARRRLAAALEQLDATNTFGERNENAVRDDRKSLGRSSGGSLPATRRATSEHT
ncbi:sigma-70 family RNA polymerase sigma factor [Micromonospora sp. NBC_01699]|uniref:RNA polymerase sigma factor n=1 Tax=Micromonospora sp. NBC_01699 TaxID=2975984 RepID=UPI002E2F7E0A|nr:sigma-70 family RNA polymerase sigma factor [Micromonospora sp. NBC_01699]